MYLKLILPFAFIFVMNVNGLSNMLNSSFAREATEKCDLSAKPQCSSDCTKILVCYAGMESPMLSIKCGSNTPYCDKGQCVSAPGSCLIKSNSSSFTCTSAGVFPDPFNCSQSHYCSEGGSSSVLSECPKGRIFDSKLKLCVQISSLNFNNRRICQKISCNRVTNNFILYPTNPAFYAYCFVTSTGVRQTYMYKCNDEANKVFDLKTNMCRFNCKSIGYHADPLNCSSYYICNGLKFASRHVHCPPNYYFNGTVCLNSKAHCAPGSIPDMTTITTEKTMTDGVTMMTEGMTDSMIESMINSESVPINAASQSITGSASHSMTELEPQLMTDSTHQSITDSVPQSMIDSAPQSITDLTPQSMTDSTPQSMTNSTPQSMNDSTPQSMTDSTPQLMTDSALLSMSDSSSESITVSASQSMTDPASQSMNDQITDPTVTNASNIPPSSGTMDIQQIGSQINTSTKTPR